MDDINIHSVAMNVRAIRNGLDDLNKLITAISDHDAAELDLARFDLEQLLMKLRFPILQREAAE